MRMSPILRRNANESNSAPTKALTSRLGSAEIERITFFDLSVARDVDEKRQLALAEGIAANSNPNPQARVQTPGSDALSGSLRQEQIGSRPAFALLPPDNALA